MNWARVYRLALRAVSADLRVKHGRAMEALFAREVKLARQRGRLPGGLAALAGIWDALRTGLVGRVHRGVGRIRGGVGTILGDRGRRQRHARKESWGGRFLHELRQGIRSLGRTPAFTVTSVVILALGIGTSTAVFTGFRAVVLDELPVTAPDRIVLLSLEREPTGSISLIPEEVGALRRESRTMLGVAGVASFGAEAIPLTEDGRSLVLNMSRVTPNYFDVLGTRPVLGRR
ncbi:MAG TPA: hypothetical protein VHG09_03930, partial [Longimicrobiales bacterium]|nr:hypothetical protein [Longimicrobiales bacterium]